MRAETIAIGTELLLGALVDTNSAHIARQLRNIGLDLLYMSAVGDNEARIAAAVRQGMARSGVVITTGGLGPTQDDMTRQAVAAATGRELVYSDELAAQIEERFSRFGRRMSDNNRQQAYIPTGAIAIENPVGTAPIFIVDNEDSIVVCLPGVPREMTYLLENDIIPWLRKRLDLRAIIKSRILRTTGLGESVLDEQIRDLEQLTNPTVGLAAHTGIVDIRITAKAANDAEADRMINSVEQQCHERLGDAIFGVDDDNLAEVTLAQLIENRRTVASAEAGTGGLLAQQLATAGNSAAAFVQGRLLPPPTTGLDNDSLRAMAADIARAHGADYGLVCMIAVHERDHDIGFAISHPTSGASKVRVRNYSGYHEYARSWSVNSCLNLLRTWSPDKAAAE